MSAALIRSVDVKRLGIRPDLNTPEIELFARLAAEGRSFVFVPEYLAEYRVHPHSQTSAGLAGERLIKYLDPIPVRAHVEPVKHSFMSALLVSAVNEALKGGDVECARAMMRHRYYPSLRGQLAHVLVHRALASLPPIAAKWSFHAAAATRHGLRRAFGI